MDQVNSDVRNSLSGRANVCGCELYLSFVKETFICAGISGKSLHNRVKCHQIKLIGKLILFTTTFMSEQTPTVGYYLTLYDTFINEAPSVNNLIPGFMVMHTSSLFFKIHGDLWKLTLIINPIIDVYDVRMPSIRSHLIHSVPGHLVWWCCEPPLGWDVSLQQLAN